MNLFEAQLQDAYLDLTEATSPMTMKQKQQVSKMKSSGWDILKRKGDTVIMVKGDKEVFVYASGKTFFITEAGGVDITELVELYDEV